MSAVLRARGPGLTLGGFSLVVIGLVGVIHFAMESRIAANRAAQQRQALEMLLPAGRYDNDPLRDPLNISDPALGPRYPLTLYRARQAGQPVAVVVATTAPDGYSGSIRLLVAADPAGTLLGVRVVEHRETPGLGDAIEIGKSDWILGFAGRSLDDPPVEKWQIRKDGGDFDQFAGATITPRAVVGAVRRTLTFLRDHRSAVFQSPAASGEPRP